MNTDASPFSPFLDLPGSIAPDYGGHGLLNLMSSLRQRFGDTRLEAPVLAHDSALALVRANTVVLLVIDGLGAHDLARRGSGGFIASHQVAILSTVFPATTASAVTATLTGIAPAAHGLTGWFIRDDRFGGVLAPLPMVRRDRQPMEGWWRMRRLFPYKSLFQRLRARCVAVAPSAILGSPFNMRHTRGCARRYAYDTLAEFGQQVVQAVSDLGGAGGFVYAYFPDYDALAHGYGIASAECDAAFEQIDREIEAVAARLAGKGAQLVLTADHGFIDSPPARQLDLASVPAVAALVDGPLWGERRVAFARARQGQTEALLAQGTTLLGDRFRVVPGSQLIEAGLFGPAHKASAQLATRVGDVAFIGRENWTLYDRLPNEPDHSMIGVHGGVSAEEMLIPLVSVVC